MKNKFTVAALLYGDYPKLAERCLTSIANTFRLEDLNLRVGLNEVAPYITDWVRSWVPAENIYEESSNINKYPLLRKMVHGDNPITTDYFMWFDDDSWLVDHTVGSGTSYWPQLVDHAMVNADMIGSIYSMDMHPRQRAWIKDQPWYAGKDPANRKFRFATGGWWTIRTEILYKYDWPWPALSHNGGDSTLGEMLLQQDLRLRHFNTGVKINASDHGKESSAPRRGTNSKPIGHDFSG